MVLPTRRKAFQIAYGGGYKIYHLSSQYINKIVGYPKKSRPVPPWKVSRKHGKYAHLRKVGRGCWRRKRGYRRYRGARAITHLRKVSKKRGKYAHLRKVGKVGWKRKRGYRPYRGSRANCTPLEGEQKTREIRTPSEGGMRRLETKTRVQALQRVPGQLRTFGR